MMDYMVVMDRQVLQDQGEEGIRVRQDQEEEQVRRDELGLLQRVQRELLEQQEAQELQVQRDLRPLLAHKVPQDLKVSQRARRAQEGQQDKDSQGAQDPLQQA
jgi:hypothetical protein